MYFVLTFIPGSIRLVWKKSIARSGMLNIRLYKRYALIIIPTRPCNSVQFSSNRLMRTTSFNIFNDVYFVTEV